MVEVSVIVPCFNGEETLAEALDSLLAQVAPVHWEILMADNGSTDRSRAIFEAAAARRPDIPMRLVDASARRGKSFGLNTAIAAARGDRILFLDADDTVAPGWLAAMAAALDRDPFVTARLDYEKHNSPEAQASRERGRQVAPFRLAFPPRCLHSGGGPMGFRREVFDRVGPFDLEMTAHEDTDFSIRAHLAGYRLAFVPAAIYHYRYRTEPDEVRRQARTYARYEALLRRRYAGEGSRLSPSGWIAYGLDRATLALGDLALAVRGGRRRDTLARARRRGALEGALEGARLHGVAPDPATFRQLGRRAAKIARRAALRAIAPWRPETLGVRTSEKVIALTFDDGPDPETTPILLDILGRLGAKATFFVIGERAARRPDLIARIVAEGHEIGNHSWDHPSLAALPLAEIEAQIERTRAVLAPHGQRLMRPPYGDLTLAGIRLMKRLGCRVVLWNVNGEDWRDDDADTLTERILSKAGPGSIVLLHDSLRTFEDPAFRDRAPTFAAVEAVIARRPDYRFVTVSELLAAGPPIERAVPKTSESVYIAALDVAPA